MAVICTRAQWVAIFNLLFVTNSRCCFRALCIHYLHRVECRRSFVITEDRSRPTHVLSNGPVARNANRSTDSLKKKMNDVDGTRKFFTWLFMKVYELNFFLILPEF